MTLPFDVISRKWGKLLGVFLGVERAQSQEGVVGCGKVGSWVEGGLFRL